MPLQQIFDAGALHGIAKMAVPIMYNLNYKVKLQPSEYGAFVVKQCTATRYLSLGPQVLSGLGVKLVWHLIIVHLLVSGFDSHM